MIRSALALLTISLCAPMSLRASEFVVVHAGKLMDIPGNTIKTEASVVIRDGIVVAIEAGFVDASEFDANEDDTVTTHDLSDSFVLPGLIDSHVHITDQLDARAKLRRVEFSDPATVLFAANNARLTLEAGFTTVRDLGGRGGDSVFALRDAINKGYVPGPRIFAAGDVISPTGGHGQRHGYRDDVFTVVNHTGVCDGADDCRRAVRNQVRRSADHIKYVSTGGVLSETAAGTGQQFFDEEQKAIVEAAHSLGRKVTAHAHNADGINAALRAGVDGIEHGTFANKESIRLFKQTGAYLVPTILAGATVAAIADQERSFFAPTVREKARRVGPQLIKTVSLLHKEGVRLAFGTDSYVSQHGENAREFSLLVEAGLTPTEAIVTATVNGADNLGQSEVLGSLEVGKLADLIAVDGDPRSNVDELLDVNFVMKQGEVYKDK